MTIFINNKYTKWYNDLIDHRRQNIPDGYVEKHHIIPDCLYIKSKRKTSRSIPGVLPGDPNHIDNIVKLTAREHVVAHWLLTKCVTGQFQRLMESSLSRMLSNSNNKRILTPIEAARCREAASISVKEFRSLPEVKERYKQTNADPKIKAKRSMAGKLAQSRPEVKLKRAEGMKKANSRPETKSKRSSSAAKSVAREGAKEAISASMRLYCSRTDVKEHRSNVQKKARSCPLLRAKVSEKCKGYFWWTDGQTEVKSKVCPSGFQRGRLRRIKS